MELKTKKRVIGGLVLAGVVLLILPFLFHDQQPTSSVKLAAENSKTSNVSEIQLSLPDQQKSVESQNREENHIIPTESIKINTMRTATPPVTPTTSVVSPASKTPEKNAVSIVSSPVVIKNKKITHTVVEIPHKKIEKKSYWVIQVGAFSNAQNAKQLIHKLRTQGLKPYTDQTINVHNKSLIAVFVGRETSYEKILVLQKKINHRLFINGVIKKD